MRTAALLLALLLGACSFAPERPIAERLIGSWRQSVSVLGHERESIITFRADGSFEEATRNVTPGEPRFDPRLVGTWRVSGDVLTLVYSNGFTGDGPAEEEQRRVTKLDARSFVSADLRFGLVVDRERWPPLNAT